VQKQGNSNKMLTI